MILTKQEPFRREMFAELARTGDDLDIRSTLTTEVALAGIAEFIAATGAAEDAVFAHYEAAAVAALELRLVHRPIAAGSVG